MNVSKLWRKKCRRLALTFTNGTKTWAICPFGNHSGGMALRPSNTAAMRLLSRNVKNVLKMLSFAEKKDSLLAGSCRNPYGLAKRYSVMTSEVKQRATSPISIGAPVLRASWNQ
jgi:hypothetical protein